jgi:hypothetical protein
MTQASQTCGIRLSASSQLLLHMQAEETLEKPEKSPHSMLDKIAQYVHHKSDILRSPSPGRAVRPTCHWWRCPRVLAWFRVLMVWALVKPPTSAGPLSRIGDYLFAARGPGLFLRLRRRTTFPPKNAVTRGPPHPLFHRRPRSGRDAPPNAAPTSLLRLGVGAMTPGSSSGCTPLCGAENRRRPVCGSRVALRLIPL